MKKISIILPVYNEAEVIEDFNTALFEVLHRLEQKYLFNVIYIVDKSSDDSIGLLRGICKRYDNVKLIALSRRFGHQMSLLAGMDKCDSDAVIMMDSDLQHPPSLIPTMLNEFEKGYDIVYTIRQDTTDISFFKRLSSKIFYKLINSLSQVPINESAADFRLISRKVLHVFQYQIRERNQFLRGLFSWVGFESIGVPFQVGNRRAGKSKYTLGRMTQFGIAGVISFSKRPLQAAVYMGLIFAFFSIVYALKTFVQFFYLYSLPSGWTTLVILISMFSGIQLIFLGIIGEYIAGIFDEVKARPHYIIEETVNDDNIPESQGRKR